MTEPAPAGEHDPAPLHAFEAYGLEIEYMIVARDTLDVLPVADLAFERGGARPGSGDLEAGPLAWSNELVRHVVELKNVAPCDLAALPARLQGEIGRFGTVLAGLGARLMPGGVHPWMDPARETELWPHGNTAVYRAYDRIFGCRGHGWSNLQSTHINLPFSGDAEFARLHAAVRVVLPLVPALAASSPFLEGRPAAALDARMEAYRVNSARVPSLTGAVIPASVTTRAEYEAAVLAPMYRDIAPLDPDGVLRHEWLNAHGAIARFSRSALEIRVMDAQECPAADVGLAALVVDLVQALYEERFAPLPRIAAAPVALLARPLLAGIRDADAAVIQSEYLGLFGVDAAGLEARDLWLHIVDRLDAGNPRHAGLWQPVAQTVLERGSLARRLRAAAGPHPDRAGLEGVYRELCACLDEGRLFAA